MRHLPIHGNDNGLVAPTGFWHITNGSGFEITQTLSACAFDYQLALLKALKLPFRKVLPMNGKVSRLSFLDFRVMMKGETEGLNPTRRRAESPT